MLSRIVSILTRNAYLKMRLLKVKVGVGESTGRGGVAYTHYVLVFYLESDAGRVIN